MKSPVMFERFFIGFIFAAVLLTTFGGINEGRTAEGDVAIMGYDTVAYFQAGRAIKGTDSFTYQWHNTTWHFQTKENRDLFAASPEKFAPQYDGYCAWALTEQRKAVTDPKVWKIVNGKLYLNCSQGAYEKWRRDIPGHIKKSDANWRKMNSGN